MSLNTALMAELKSESANTRKILERVPEDKILWSPHEKSMKLGRLATHVAELPIWIDKIMNTDEINFATPAYKSEIKQTNAELLQLFDERFATAIQILETATDEDLNALWTVKRGEQVMFRLPKKVALRNFTLNHTYHHRGQLSVYLRLLDIAVPGMYGPSADEMMF